jgi:hypothetical protein
LASLRFTADRRGKASAQVPSVQSRERSFHVLKRFIFRKRFIEKGERILRFGWYLNRYFFGVARETDSTYGSHR